MKAYGVRKADAGCCGGHDKYPPPCLRYSTQKRNPNMVNRLRAAKKHARQAGKNEIRQALDNQ